jgi:hypothetical protein
MVVGALPPLLFLLLDNYVLTGGPLDFPQNLQNDFDRVGFGPGHGGDTAVGHTPQMGFTNAVIYLREMAKDLFGWPGPFAFIFVWLAFLPAATPHPLPQGTRVQNLPGLSSHSSLLTAHSSLPYARLLLISASLGLASAYFFWWAAARIFGPRYWYEMLPFLLLLTALGVVNAGRWVGNLISLPTPGGGNLNPLPLPGGGKVGGCTAAGMVASGLLLTLLIAYAAMQFTPQYIASFHDYNNMTPAERDTVAAAGLHHAVVFVQLDAQTRRRDYSRVFWLNDPLLTHRADVIWLRDLGSQQDNATMQQYFAGWGGWTINRTVLQPLH